MTRPVDVPTACPDMPVSVCPRRQFTEYGQFRIDPSGTVPFAFPAGTPVDERQLPQ